MVPNDEAGFAANVQRLALVRRRFIAVQLAQLDIDEPQRSSIGQPHRPLAKGRTN
jgi:hypothetical protein